MNHRATSYSTHTCDKFISAHICLKDMPVFASIYHEFLEFIGEDSILVAHNAPFDMKFVNAELKTVGHAAIDNKRVRDSLVLARKKFPGSPASLDALCRRFSIGLEGRELHGALLDAQLLADVWMELNGGRQHGLGLNANTDQSNAQTAAVSAQAIIDRPARTPRPHAAKPEELEAHGALVGELKDPLWPVG